MKLSTLEGNKSDRFVTTITYSRILAIIHRQCCYSKTKHLTSNTEKRHANGMSPAAVTVLVQLTAAMQLHNKICYTNVQYTQNPRTFACNRFSTKVSCCLPMSRLHEICFVVPISEVVSGNNFHALFSDR